MKCQDKRTRLLLSDYFSGHLGESDCRLVEAHLAECQDCRKALKTMELLTGEQADPSSGPPHIAKELLAQYYQDKSAFDPDTLHAIENHLAECADCAYEVSFLRDLEEVLASSVKASPATPSLLQRLSGLSVTVLKKPAFAYFLLLLTIYPATRHLLQFRTDQRPSFEVPSQVYHLREMTRSAAKLPAVTYPKDQRMIQLAIPYYHSVPDCQYHFIILDSTHTELVSAQRIPDLSQNGVIRLLLSTEGLADGLYMVQVNEIDRLSPTDTTTSVYPFELRAE